MIPFYIEENEFNHCSYNDTFCLDDQNNIIECNLGNHILLFHILV